MAYSGAVPLESFLSLHGGTPRISSYTVDFCSKNLSTEEIGRLSRFLAMFAGTKHLHVESARMGVSMESKHFRSFPTFASLMRPDLTGRLPRNGAANAVRRIFLQTPNLECLTLQLMPLLKEQTWGYYGLDDDDEDEKRRKRDGDDCFTAADESEFSSIDCLRRRVTTINLVRYNGDEEAQRLLAKLLLSNALVLARVCIELPKQRLAWQVKQKNDIEGWLVSKSAKAIFT